MVTSVPSISLSVSARAKIPGRKTLREAWAERGGLEQGQSGEGVRPFLGDSPLGAACWLWMDCEAHAALPSGAAGAGGSSGCRFSLPCICSVHTSRVFLANKAFVCGQMASCIMEVRR